MKKVVKSLLQNYLNIFIKHVMIGLKQMVLLLVYTILMMIMYHTTLQTLIKKTLVSLKELMIKDIIIMDIMLKYHLFH